MSNIERTLEIDSTYRNRKINPLASDFDIPFYFGAYPPSILTSQDPISLSFPSEQNLSFGAYPGVATTTVTLATSAIPYDDNYNNYYIENDCNTIGGAHGYSLILSYDGATRIATLQTAITPTNNYNIRREIPEFRSSFGAGSTTTQLNLGGAASTVDNFYVNCYVRIFSGGAAFQYGIITSYVGATRIATIRFPLTAAPAAGDDFEICRFTKDNFSPLIYQNTMVNQPVSYEIRLVSLVVPHVEFKNGYRGFVENYPYLYVKLFNKNYNPGQTILITNNPNAKEAIFRCPATDISSTSQSFYTLYYNDTIQTITFKPDDSLHFSVCFPNGEPIETLFSDYESPSLPNGFLQFSATFAIKRLS